MKRTLLLAVAFAAFSACERPDPSTSAAEPAVSTPMKKKAPKDALPAPQMAPAVQPTAADRAGPGEPAVLADKPVAPDNTGKNERDRSGTTLTPGDQSESAADLSITQQIRQGVVKSDGLSMAARNVKIITADGVVTLRGPVESVQEKSTIAAIAKRTDGAKRVDNQLEVAAK